MAQPIRFDQDPEGPEGAGDFEFDTGQRIYAYDPDIAAQLASLQGQLEEPDMRTAEVDPTAAAVPGSTADQELSEALGRQAVQFGVAPNDSVRTVPDVAGAIRPQAAPPPPGVPPQAPAGATGMQPVNLGGAQPMAPQPVAPPMVYQAPRAGGYQPATQATVEERGPGYDADLARMRGDLNAEVQRANMAQFEAQEMKARHDAALLKAQLPALELEAAKKQRELQAKQDAYKVERAKAQTYVDAAYQRKVDPKAIYNDAGTAGSIALVIGQALGAFGASITHTDNYAQRLVDRAIANSIAAQQQAIQDGQAGADNMLARIAQDLGGDVEQAKLVMDMSARKLLESQIQEQKLNATSVQAQQAADIWLAQNQQAFMAAEQKFYEASLGKTTTTTATKYEAPRSGGYVPMSLDEQVKRKKATDYLQGRTDASGKPIDEADPKQVERYAKRRESPENMLGQIDDIIGLAGGKIENGQIKFGDDDVPGIGPLASRAPDWLLSNRGQAIRQTASNLASDVVKDKSGAAVTDVERKLLIQMMEGATKTEEQFRTGLGIIRRYAERKRRNIEASAPRGVRETYRKQGREAVGEEYESEESDVERY